MDFHQALFPAKPIPPVLMVWRDAKQQPQPNTWTYFRKTVSLPAGRLPAHALFAADPTARLWINGHLVIDRTMRFVTPQIPLELVDTAPFLRAGDNVIVILHHWWGVPTFQRSPGGAPGVFFQFQFTQPDDAVKSTAAGTAESVRADTAGTTATDAAGNGWQWRQADEFAPHPFQTLGHDGSHRIRFPVLLDQRAAAETGIHSAEGDGLLWQPAVLVSSAAWSCPLLKETPPLHSDTVHPQACIASGSICRKAVEPTQPHEVGKRIRESRHTALAATAKAKNAAGSTQQAAGASSLATAGCPHRFGANSFLTLDFGKPVHGFLRLEIEAEADGTVLEIGYGELAVDPRSSEPLLSASGHFDPEFTCGAPFGDQVILRKGRQSIYLPDERTWRWLLIHCLPPAQDTNALPVQITAATAAAAQDGGDAALATLLRIDCKTSQHPVKLVGSFEVAVPAEAAGAKAGVIEPAAAPAPTSAPAQLTAPAQTADRQQVSDLVRLCLDHALVSMSDTYVDTTGREDAQWLEDIQYRARLAASWYGDSTLRQVTLRHAVEQQDQQSGLFRVFAPEDYGDIGCQFLDWGMAWIGLLHDDWLWSGSTERIRRYYPALKKFTAKLNHLTTPDGLLTGWLCLADNHGSERLDHSGGAAAGVGCESIPNTWYYGYLRQAAQMARAIGHSGDAAEFDRRADAVQTGFQRFFTTLHEGGHALPTISEVWTPAGGPRGYGQAAVVNAVFHGLVTDAQEARAMLLAAFPGAEGIPAGSSSIKRWNTPTTIYRVLRVLCEHGLGQLARAHLLATYAPSLPHGPLPEYFLPGKGQPIDPTGSHGWAAVPLAWLHDTVLGVQHEYVALTVPDNEAAQSVAAGETTQHVAGSEATKRVPSNEPTQHVANAEAAQRIRIRVRPSYVGWQSVSGTVATPAGPVTVDIDWQAQCIRVQSPPGIEVIQEFPDTTCSEKQPSTTKPAAVVS